jgi:hypothetical protein
MDTWQAALDRLAGLHRADLELRRLQHATVPDRLPEMSRQAALELADDIRHRTSDARLKELVGLMLELVGPAD